MNWLTKSWLEGSTYSTDNQDFSQEHSLPNVIEFALATKREPNIHIHESTHTHTSEWVSPPSIPVASKGLGVGGHPMYCHPGGDWHPA